jgi:hypothetical protein
MRETAPTLPLCGIAGMVGASLLLAADWTLLGTFSSGSEFKENWCALLSEMPRWRLLIGGLVGPVGAWFYVVGFWQLYLNLKPAGRPLAFAVFAGFSMSFVWVAGAIYEDTDPKDIEMERKADLSRCAADLWLVERAKEWLLGE